MLAGRRRKIAAARPQMALQGGRYAAAAALIPCFSDAERPPISLPPYAAAAITLFDDTLIFRC